MKAKELIKLIERVPLMELDVQMLPGINTSMRVVINTPEVAPAEAPEPIFVNLLLLTRSEYLRAMVKAHDKLVFEGSLYTIIGLDDDQMGLSVERTSFGGTRIRIPFDRIDLSSTATHFTGWRGFVG